MVQSDGVLVSIVLGINIAFLSYFIAINTNYSILLVVSFFSVLRYQRRTQYEQWRRIIQSPLTIPVSIIAPAYNEELNIDESVKSLLMLEYNDIADRLVSILHYNGMPIPSECVVQGVIEHQKSEQAA